MGVPCKQSRMHVWVLISGATPPYGTMDGAVMVDGAIWARGGGALIPAVGWAAAWYTPRSGSERHELNHMSPQGERCKLEARLPKEKGRPALVIGKNHVFSEKKRPRGFLPRVNE